MVPAVRETLDAYQDLYSAHILQPSSCEILKHVLSKFITRMATNVEDICLTTYVLSLEGRNEIRAREMGFAVAEVHSRGGDGEHLASIFDEGVRDGYVPDVSGDFACFSDSSGSDEELAEERCEMEDEPIEGKEEVQTEEFTLYHRLQVALLETGDIDQMLRDPLYSDLVTKADRCVGSLAEKLAMSPIHSIQCFHHWIEMTDEALRFPLLRDRAPDAIWRHAHQYDDW
jgi:hypothetical protein